MKTHLLNVVFILSICLLNGCATTATTTTTSQQPTVFYPNPAHQFPSNNNTSSASAYRMIKPAM